MERKEENRKTNLITYDWLDLNDPKIDKRN